MNSSRVGSISPFVQAGDRVKEATKTGLGCVDAYRTRPKDEAPTLRQPGSSVAAKLVGISILLLIPGSLVWWPLFSIPGAGTVAASDALLLILWPVTLWTLSRWNGSARLRRRALVIAGLPALIGLLGALAAALYTSSLDAGFLEFALQAKRFGLAAIVPAAMLVSRASAIRRVARPVIVATLIANVGMVLFPEIMGYLPVAEMADARVFEQGRGAGLVLNPNDLAYVSMGLMVCYMALSVEDRPGTFWGTPVNWVVTGAAAFNLVTSGSRSGILGAGVAAAYFVIRNSDRWSRRLVPVLALTVALLVGTDANEVLASRLSRAYERGISEENIAERLAAQEAGVRSAARNVWGVGSRNAKEVLSPYLGRSALFVGTTDSVYVDTLVASGVLGLLALLLLWRRAWTFVSVGVSPRSAAILQSGLIGFAVVGLASVSPASFSVAPTFFFLIGTAGVSRAH